MKFIKVIAFTICLLNIIPISYGQELSKNPDLLAGYQVLSICSKGNNVVALTLKVESSPGSWVVKRNSNFFDGKKWEILNNNVNDSNSTIEYTEFSSAVFDSVGTIWMSGKSALYNLDSSHNHWSKLTILDSISVHRKIRSIVSGKRGEIYCFSVASVPSDTIVSGGVPTYIIGYSVYEIYSLKNQRFEKIFYEKLTNSSYSGILSTDLNGDLVFARSSPKWMNSSLLFYKNGVWIDSELQTPIGLGDRQETKQIVTDNLGGLWFAFGSSTHAKGFSSGGLSYLRADGSWKHFLPSDGMPNTVWKGDPDGARSISIDKSGNIWVGLISGLVRIDSKDKIEIMDLMQPKNIVPFSELYTNDTTTPIDNNFRWSVDYSTITDDGSIWLSYTPYGLIRYKPNSTTSVLHTFNTELQEHILYQCSSSTLQIPINENFTTPPTPKVFDYTGKELPMQQFYYTDKTLSVDVSHLSNGMYYLSLTTQDKGNTFFFTVHR